MEQKKPRREKKPLEYRIMVITNDGWMKPTKISFDALFTQLAEMEEAKEKRSKKIH